MSEDDQIAGYREKITGYDDLELEDALESIDRRRFPERYLVLIDELAARGHYGVGMTAEEHAAMRYGSAGREAWRFKVGCLLVWLGLMLLMWFLAWLGQVIG